MKKSTKKGMRLAAVLLALVMAVGGSLAYFTDYADTSASGTAGTVDIEVNQLFPNEPSLVPGTPDNHEFNWNIMNPGDYLPLTYEIQNLGNKSVDVRTTITLTSSVPMITDANGQAQFELYAIEDLEWVDGEGAKPKAGATPLEVRSISDNGLVITYNIPDYILNGSNSELLWGVPVGDGEVEPDAIQNDEIKGVYESGADTVGISAAYQYALVFRGDSSNDYQGATVVIDALFEAKQHRNTEAGWELVAEADEIVPGNANPVYVGDIFETLAPDMIAGTPSSNSEYFDAFLLTTTEAYMYKSENGTWTVVPVTAHTFDGEYHTAEFTFEGNQYVVTANTEMRLVSMLINGVEYAGGNNGGETPDTPDNPGDSGNQGNESTLYDSMLKDGYSEVYNDGKFLIVSKTYPYETFVEYALFLTEDLSGYLWIDRIFPGDGQTESINDFGIVMYEDGKWGFIDKTGGYTPSNDNEMHNNLLAEGYNETEIDKLVVMYQNDGKQLTVYVFEFNGEDYYHIDTQYAEVIDDRAEVKTVLGEMVYEKGELSMKSYDSVTHESLTADGYEMNNDTKDYVLYYKATNDGKSDILSTYVYDVANGNFITGEELHWFDGSTEGTAGYVINFVYADGKMSTSVITQSGGESGDIETPTDDYYIYESLSKEGYYEYNFNKDYIVMALDDGKQVVMYVFDTSNGSYQMIDKQYVESENGYAEVKTSVGYFVYNNGNIYAQ